MRKLFITLLIFVTVLNVAAQDTLRLSLPQALAVALSESPTIKIAEMEIQRVDYSKKSAVNALIPGIELSGQYAKYVSPAKMNMFGMTMNSPTDFNANLGANLSLPLFAPALWHSIQMSDLEIENALEKAKASKIGLRNEVTKAYYTVLVVQDSYQVLLDGYELAKSNYEVAKRGYEIGALAAYDYISAEVQLNNLLPSILQAENGIKQTKTMLKILMGLDVAQPVEVVGKLDDFKEQIVPARSLTEFSFDNNSDLRQLDIGRKQLQKSLQLQRTQRMPTLAAFAQSGYTGMGTKETELDFGGLPIVTEARKDWFSSGTLVGLQLRIPITDIFTGNSKEKQIKIQEESLLLQREQAFNAIQLQAETNLDMMNKSVEQVGAAVRSVELAEKAYDISSKRYENGAGSMIELQNASLAITQARLSYHQAISEYLNARADLEKLLGEEF